MSTSGSHIVHVRTSDGSIDALTSVGAFFTGGTGLWRVSAVRAVLVIDGSQVGSRQVLDGHAERPR